jgi:hypothetical protein
VGHVWGRCSTTAAALFNQVGNTSFAGAALDNIFGCDAIIIIVIPLRVHSFFRERPG